MDTNGHYLATILKVFSDNANPVRFLPSVCHQILNQVLFYFYRQFADRMSTNAVRFLAAVCRYRQILQILYKICWLSGV